MKRLRGAKLASKFKKEMKRKGISFDDVLKDLKEIRKKHNKEKYGI